MTLSLKTPSNLKCVATLPCEMSSVFKATIGNETNSVTTHFLKINDGEQRVYCLGEVITTPVPSINMVPFYLFTSLTWVVLLQVL